MRESFHTSCHIQIEIDLNKLSFFPYLQKYPPVGGCSPDWDDSGVEMREFPFNGNLWRPWLPVFCQEWGSSRPFPARVIISRWWCSPLLWDFYHFLTLCKAHRGKSCPSYIILLCSVIIDYWLSLQGITWFKILESLCSKICSKLFWLMKMKWFVHALGNQDLLSQRERFVSKSCRFRFLAVSGLSQFESSVQDKWCNQGAYLGKDSSNGNFREMVEIYTTIDPFGKVSH